MAFLRFNRARQVIAGLGLACGLAAFAQGAALPHQANAETAQAPQGTVILWNKTTDDGDNLKFNPAWGWSNQYMLKATDRPIQTGQVRYLRFVNIPSASTLVISSGEFCEQTQDQDFWIELTSVRENATLPTGEGDASVLPVAELMSLQKDQNYNGLRVKSKYLKPGASLDGLACVRMTTSRLPGQAIPTAPFAMTQVSWQRTDFATLNGACHAQSPFLAGLRSNIAAGEGAAWYGCAMPRAEAKVDVQPMRHEVSFEKGYDLCPPHQTLQAYKAQAEYYDGTFSLTCQTVRDANERPLSVLIQPTWHGPYTSTDQNFQCPGNSVLVGRKTEKKSGDSVRSTKIWHLCGTVQAYADSPPSLSAVPQAAGTVGFLAEDDKRYTIELGEPGSDQHYEFRNWGSAVPNNSVRKIAFSAIPSATRIVLTDDELCRPDQGTYAVTLVSWKEGASLPEVNLSDLGANDVGYPVGQGLRLEAIRGDPKRDSLSCMRVQLPGQPPLDTPLPLSDKAKYTTRGNATCANAALSSLALQLDTYTYECASTEGLELRNPQRLKVDNSIGKWVMCPYGKVLSAATNGIDGSGTYDCAEPTLTGNALAVRAEEDWRTVNEDGVASCPSGKAIVGLRPAPLTSPTHVRCASVQQ
jgi:hypothetical protein